MALRSVRRSLDDKFHLIEILRVKTQTSSWMLNLNPESVREVKLNHHELVDRIIDGYDHEKITDLSDQINDYKTMIDHSNLGFFHAVYAVMLVILMWGFISLIVDLRRGRQRYVG